MDFEFLEGTQDKRYLGIKYGQTKPTIDMISIGLVSEDNREYYAVSKDFNLKEAWNRYEIKAGQVYGDMRNQFPNGIRTKIHWIRKHVLSTIFTDFLKLEKQSLERQERLIGYAPPINTEFTYSNFKRLLNKYGKTNKQIAKSDYLKWNLEQYVEVIHDYLTVNGLKKFIDFPTKKVKLL